jgi:hypothetical protein
MTFRNPNDRVIEGRFEINLPPARRSRGSRC